MARPKKVLTDAQIAQVESLAGFLTIQQIADYLGIADRTLHRRMEEDEAVLSAYKRGRSTVIRDVANNLITKARDGDLGAMCFYLKTQAGWRETNRTEITGADGGPVQMQPIQPMPYDEWMKRFGSSNA